MNFKSETDRRGSDYTPAQMLKSPLFWFCFFYIMLLSAVGSTVISFAKDLSLAAGADSSLAIWLTGVISVCNGIGRVVAGAAIDAVGERKVMITANLLTFAATLLVLFSLLTVSVPLGIFGLCLTGLSYGANPSISSTVVADFFGTRFFASNLSLMGINLMGAAGIATVAGLLYAGAGSFAAPLLLLVVLTCVGIVFNICIWSNRSDRS